VDKGQARKLVKLAAGKERRPALAFDEDRVHLITVESANVVLRSAAREGDFLSNLAKAQARSIAAGQAPFGTSAAVHSGSLFVAFGDKLESGAFATRIVRVPPQGEPETSLIVEEEGYGTRTPHRLVATENGTAFVANIRRQGRTQAVLIRLDPSGKEVGRVVLSREEAAKPHLQKRDGIIAATWYSRSRDAVYAAFVDSKNLLRGPWRIDTPAQRAPRGAPKIVALGKGRWRVYFRESSSIFSALLTL
jgi:hypothetical protein